MDMTAGSPAKTLLAFAAPIILSNLFQQFYNLIDSLIVGNCLGADALAAVGSAGAVTAVVVQLASGLALGASVVIAQYFGAGRKEKIRVCMTTISLFCVGAGVLATGWLLPIFSGYMVVKPVFKGVGDMGWFQI